MLTKLLTSQDAVDRLGDNQLYKRTSGASGECSPLENSKTCQILLCGVDDFKTDGAAIKEMVRRSLPCCPICKCSRWQFSVQPSL